VATLGVNGIATKRAVILAAGRGGRLGDHTAARAKCLVPVLGRPLIDYVLTALAGAGIEDVVIVVGYQGEQVEADVGDGERFGIRIQYVWNRDYMRGNASSLQQALPLVESEPFLLVMSDHLCSATLFRTFLEQVQGRSALAVDASEHEAERVDEATKVALVDGNVADLGKQIDAWHALDTGVSHWAAGAFALRNGNGAPVESELAALMARLARSEGGLAACQVSGHFWLDVDTDGDLRLAERLLQADDRLLA
jgi:choline kinase